MLSTPRRNHSTTGTSVLFKCSIGNLLQLSGTRSFLLFSPLFSLPELTFHSCGTCAPEFSSSNRFLLFWGGVKEEFEVTQGLPIFRSFSWQSDFPWTGACSFSKPTGIPHKPTDSASRCTPGIPSSFCKPGLLPPPASPQGQSELLGLGRPFGLLEQALNLLLVPFSLAQAVTAQQLWSSGGVRSEGRAEPRQELQSGGSRAGSSQGMRCGSGSGSAPAGNAAG